MTNFKQRFRKLIPNPYDAVEDYSYDKAQKWLDTHEHLYTGNMYDEPMWTLDEDKIEKFIQSELRLLIEELEGEMSEPYAPIELTYDEDTFNHGFNSALSQIHTILEAKKQSL